MAVSKDAPAFVQLSFDSFTRSVTRSAEELPRTTAFATLRFRGDRLDPDRITAIPGVQPTKAYRKGERYLAGPCAGYVTGRTGVWALASDGRIETDFEVDEV